MRQRLIFESETATKTALTFKMKKSIKNYIVRYCSKTSGQVEKFYCIAINNLHARNQCKDFIDLSGKNATVIFATTEKKNLVTQIIF